MTSPVEDLKEVMRLLKLLPMWSASGGDLRVYAAMSSIREILEPYEDDGEIQETPPPKIQEKHPLPEGAFGSTVGTGIALNPDGTRLWVWTAPMRGGGYCSNRPKLPEGWEFVDHVINFFGFGPSATATSVVRQIKSPKVDNAKSG